MRVIAEKRRQLAALRVNCERVRDSVRRKPENRRLRKLLADERVQVTIMRGVISELEKIRKQEKDAFWRAQAVRRKSMALEAIDFEGLPKLAPEATRAEELQAIFGLLQHNRGRWPGVRIIDLIAASMVTRGEPVRIIFDGLEMTGSERQMKTFSLYVSYAERADETDLPQVREH